MPSPLISVIMPVYNGSRYLRLAIDSLINQTFKNWEFIIIDDASTDETPGILASYTDPRIRVITNNVNLGIAGSLNKGIEFAKAEIIARMDCDDISLPRRLETQFDFLQSHKEIGLLGTWARIINANGKGIAVRKPPSSLKGLKWTMMFGNAMIHTSTMFRTEIVRELKGYNESEPCEDYELWSRFTRESEIAVIPEILVLWREHNDGYNTKHFKKRTESSINISLKNINDKTTCRLTIDDIRDLYAVNKHNAIPSAQRLKKAAENLGSLWIYVSNNWKLTPADRKYICHILSGWMLFIALKLVEFDKRASMKVVKSAFAYQKFSWCDLDTLIRYVIKLVIIRRQSPDKE